MHKLYSIKWCHQFYFILEARRHEKLCWLTFCCEVRNVVCVCVYVWGGKWMNTACLTCWALDCEDSGSGATQPQLSVDTAHTGSPPSISSWSPGSLRQTLFQLIKLVTATSRTEGQIITGRMVDTKADWLYTVNAVNIKWLLQVCDGFQTESACVIVGTPPSCSSLKLRLCPAAARTLAPCCTGPTGQRSSRETEDGGHYYLAS